MGKNGRFGKYGDHKRKDKLRTSRAVPLKGRDIIKLDEHRKIAPKHPNMGKR